MAAMFSEISGAETHEIDFAQSGDLGERPTHEVKIAFLKVASAKAAFRRAVSERSEGTPLWSSAIVVGSTFPSSIPFTEGFSCDTRRVIGLRRRSAELWEDGSLKLTFEDRMDRLPALCYKTSDKNDFGPRFCNNSRNSPHAERPPACLFYKARDRARFRAAQAGDQCNHNFQGSRNRRHSADRARPLSGRGRGDRPSYEPQ